MSIFRPEPIILDEPTTAHDPYRNFKFTVKWEGTYDEPEVTLLDADMGDSHDQFANVETSYLFATDFDLFA